jgi:hypothetical protein
MNVGSRLISISAPIDMKNSAANMSLSGVASTTETECIFDSATKTPAKNAPAATDIPSSNAIKAIPNATPSNASIRTS